MNVSVLMVAMTSLAATDPIPAPRDEPFPGTVELSVDATDLDHRVFAVHEELPVSGTELVLLYPQWLPGTHSPEGPLDRLAGLIIKATGGTAATRLEWVRDPGNVYAFHVPLPAGTKRVTVDFQYLSPVNHRVGRTEVSAVMLALDWNSVVLYPAGHFSRQITIAPSVRLPDGWSLATALEVASSAGAKTTFKPVSLETFIDSPLRAGRYHRKYPLAPNDRVPVTLDLMADRPEFLEVAPELIELQRNLVQQAYRLFGARHYDHYNFLLQLSDDIGWDTTLEHHRSAEYGEPLREFTDWAKGAASRDVIAHEYVHSWDGKFRRPADLWTPNFNVPMRDSLLWVYEGGTTYWGQVLTARAGVWSRQQALDALAMMIASLEPLPGRSWRALQDTTNDEIINPRRPQSWPSWQRFEDYYPEGALIWLDADTLIREKTGNTKSLDDFARGFFGINDGSFVPVTYVFEDVVKALNDVLPFDWATFLRTRLDGHPATAPLEGLARGGYKLVFTDQPSEYWQSVEATRSKSVDHSFSLGVVVDKDGALSSVRWGSPAAKAGLAAGAKLVAVDGLAYEPERLKEAIVRTGKPKSVEAIELLVRVGDRFRTVKVDYHQGLRYPHLERDPSRPALLDDILAARQ